MPSRHSKNGGIEIQTKTTRSYGGVIEESRVRVKVSDARTEVVTKTRNIDREYGGSHHTHRQPQNRPKAVEAAPRQKELEWHPPVGRHHRRHHPQPERPPYEDPTDRRYLGIPTQVPYNDLRQSSYDDPRQVQLGSISNASRSRRPPGREHDTTPGYYGAQHHQGSPYGGFSGYGAPGGGYVPQQVENYEGIYPAQPANKYGGNRDRDPRSHGGSVAGSQNRYHARQGAPYGGGFVEEGSVIDGQDDASQREPYRARFGGRFVDGR